MKHIIVVHDDQANVLHSSEHHSWEEAHNMLIELQELFSQSLTMVYRRTKA